MPVFGHQQDVLLLDLVLIALLIRNNGASELSAFSSSKTYTEKIIFYYTDATLNAIGVELADVGEELNHIGNNINHTTKSFHTQNHPARKCSLL